MGWIAIYKDGRIVREEEGAARPMQDGEEGKLLAIAQQDYRHSVAIDLVGGAVALDWDSIQWNEETKQIDLDSPHCIFYICEDTYVIGDLKHFRSELSPRTNEQGEPMFYEDGKPIMWRTDFETPVEWRPIWFSRVINGIPTKVIGAQTTTPENFGGRNVKKLISLFPDGRMGIS